MTKCGKIVVVGSGQTGAPIELVEIDDRTKTAETRIPPTFIPQAIFVYGPMERGEITLDDRVYRLLHRIEEGKTWARDVDHTAYTASEARLLPTRSRSLGYKRTSPMGEGVVRTVQGQRIKDLERAMVDTNPHNVKAAAEELYRFGMAIDAPKTPSTARCVRYQNAHDGANHIRLIGPTTSVDIKDEIGAPALVRAAIAVAEKTRQLTDDEIHAVAVELLGRKPKTTTDILGSRLKRTFATPHDPTVWLKDSPPSNSGIAIAKLHEQAEAEMMAAVCGVTEGVSFHSDRQRQLNKEQMQTQPTGHSIAVPCTREGCGHVTVYPTGTLDPKEGRCAHEFTFDPLRGHMGAFVCAGCSLEVSLPRAPQANTRRCYLGCPWDRGDESRERTVARGRGAVPLARGGQREDRRRSEDRDMTEKHWCDEADGWAMRTTLLGKVVDRMVEAIGIAIERNFRDERFSVLLLKARAAIHDVAAHEQTRMGMAGTPPIPPLPNGRFEEVAIAAMQSEFNALVRSFNEEMERRAAERGDGPNVLGGTPHPEPVLRMPPLTPEHAADLADMLLEIGPLTRDDDLRVIVLRAVATYRHFVRHASSGGRVKFVKDGEPDRFLKVRLK